MPIAHRIIPQDTLPGRAPVYFLFARCLREAPRKELLNAIVQDSLFTLAKQHGQDESYVEPVEDSQWPFQAEEIAVEYTRLFVIPGEQAVRPYESVYCDTLTVDTWRACASYFPSEPEQKGLGGFLCGPSSVSVRQAYTEAGFELDAASQELPDHLAIELEFMGRLLERGDVEQAKTFFIKHLGHPARQDDKGSGGWALRCLEDIKRNTRASFYRSLADSLTDFLQQEAKDIGQAAPDGLLG